MIFNHVFSILRWAWRSQLDWIAPVGFHHTAFIVHVPQPSPDCPSPAKTGRLRRGTRSALLVLVVATPPCARFVAPFWRAVEPLVHAPKAVQSAPKGGVGGVDDAVLDRERAQARPLARVRGHVG